MLLMASATGIRVLANICLLSEAEGGRSTSLNGWYGPNHNFGGAGDREMDTGFIEFPEGVTLSPGGSVDVELTFGIRPGLDQVVVPGRRWRIQEGKRLVGFGTVLAMVVEDPDLAATAANGRND